jgi:hypothetical protein
LERDGGRHVTRYVITIEPKTADPGIGQLKRLLKVLLRGFNFKCVGLREDSQAETKEGDDRD